MCGRVSGCQGVRVGDQEVLDGLNPKVQNQQGGWGTRDVLWTLDANGNRRLPASNRPPGRRRRQAGKAGDPGQPGRPSRLAVTIAMLHAPGGRSG